MKRMSFVAACKDFFGIKPGQSSVEFMKEIKELSPKDRTDLIAMFPSVGYEIEGAALEAKAA
jgi:hypothetical protein